MVSLRKVVDLALRIYKSAINRLSKVLALAMLDFYDHVLFVYPPGVF